MKEKLLISFSGGRTSAFMTQYLLKNYQDKYEMKVVFANTGKERKETFDFIRNCENYFGFKCDYIEAVVNPVLGKGIRAKIVTFENLDLTGQIFEAVINKHGIPNPARGLCSRELKNYTVQDYIRQIGWKKCLRAIGIRYDEFDRKSTSALKDRIIYPLCDWLKIQKEDINLFWSKMPFDLQLKSYEGNCDLCWKKSLRKKLTILKENPKIADWWIEMEKKYENFIPESQKNNKKIKLPIRFNRNYISARKLLEASKTFTDIVKDESKDVPKYKQLEIFGERLDTAEGGCASESCEAF